MWQNSQLDPTQLELLGRNIIDFGGDVDEAMVRYAREAITRLVAKGSPDITVRLTSAGGSAGAGIDIYDLLRTYPGTITGEVYGFAYSMGCIILQGCNKRRAAKHSTLLIHSIQANGIDYDEFVRPRKGKGSLAGTQRLQDAIVGILMERAKKTDRAIRAQLKRDKKMSAIEAKRFGLIDEIF